MMTGTNTPRAILFASGKGGSGKSTLCAGVAAALASLGKTVIALDADFGMRNLDIYMGLCEYALFDLSDFTEGRRELEDILTVHPEIPGLSLAAAPARPLAITPAEMKAIASALLERCDFLLVDAPAGVGSSLEVAAAGCEEAILVATPDLAAVNDAGVAAARLRAMGVRDARLAANRVQPKMISHGFGVNLDRMIDDVAVPMIGYVREDAAVARFGQNIVSMMQDKKPSMAARDMRDIAKRLLGEHVRLSLR